MNKKVTITDLAKQANVSVTTVSQILNGKEARFSDNTVAKIKRLQKEMGYVPDFNAQSLIKKNSKTIGVVVPNLNNEYFAEFLNGIQSTALKNDYMPLIFGTNDNEKSESVYLSESIRRTADGVIIASALSDIDSIDNLFSQNGIPYLLTDQNPTSKWDYIDVNDTEGGQMAAEYLIKNGHTKIALITVEKTSANIDNRVNGFKETLQKHNIDLPDENIIKVGFSKEDAYKATPKLLNLDVTAVFAINDDLAIGIYRGVNEAGKRIYDDLSIIGFDDIDMAKYIEPNLTTIHQPAFELGSRSADLIIKRIENTDLSPQTVTLPVTLIERNSVKNIVK